MKKNISSEMAVSFLPCPGEFLDPVGDRLPFDKLMSEAAKADYVLIGEGHTSVCDHKVQFEIIEGLTRGRNKVAIGLEMVTADKQDILNRFNLGQLSTDDLPGELDWENGWRYDFNMFRPVFELAAARRLTVAGLNFPFRLTKEVRDKGLEGLSAEDRAMLPEKVIPPAPEQEEGLKEVLAMHTNRDTADPVQVERFFLVQSLWDTAMAEKAVNLRKSSGHPVIILAGGGHVEHGWGIARRLKVLDPQAGVTIIMPWRGDKFYPSAADSFFYCPPSYESRMGMTVEMRLGRAVITAVKRDRKAYQKGIRPGDIIVKAQGIPVTSLSAMHMAGAKAHKENSPLIFTMDRRGEVFDLDIGLLQRMKKEK
ncbi:ChaN family lipoprotein [Maridesulfovibrio hydrothermalis]|uniref:ChaN family lipoprotein n=1 Tax=Maridesulfovibrio hydrothermalis TaxID=191026 RepID=UPI001FE0CEB0|nr:ChaN family lipoprotein [Maridesulfovibrio hydrothermalis]